MDFIVHHRSARIAALAAVFAAGLSTIAEDARAQAWKAGAPPATPPPPAAVTEAKERYKKGLKLYEEGTIDAALIELERAYELAPNYRVLYNIGQAARSQPDYATALRAFERYLTDGGREIPASRRAEVEKDVAELRDRVATITVVTNVEGASILLDELPAGKSPLAEALLVNAGRRKITVSKDALTATKVVTIAGKDSLRIELPLEEPKTKDAPPPVVVVAPAPTPTPTPTPPPPPPPPPPGPSYTWIGWVATGVLAVGAGVTGGLAIASSNDLKNQHFVGATPPSNITSLQSKTQGMAIASDVFIGGAVVSFGATLVATLVGRSKSTEPAKPPTTGGLEVYAGPRGVKLGGSF